MERVRLALIYDYLQATALRARLYDHGIEAHITEQLNTSSTAGEASIRLGGASALSSGHPVYVPAEKIEEARAVLEEFSREHGHYALRSADELQEEDTGKLLRDYRRKFLLISIVGGLLIPGFVLPVAFYFLWRYLQEGGRLFSPLILLGVVLNTTLSVLWLQSIL